MVKIKNVIFPLCLLLFAINVNGQQAPSLGLFFTIGANQLCVGEEDFTVNYTYFSANDDPTTFSIGNASALGNQIPDEHLITDAPFQASPLSITLPGDLPPGTYSISLTVSNDFGTSPVYNQTFTYGGIDIDFCASSDQTAIVDDAECYYTICESATSTQLPTPCTPGCNAGFSFGAPLGNGVWSGVGVTESLGNYYFDPTQVAGPGEYFLSYAFTCTYSGCEVTETVSLHVLAAPEISIDEIGPFCHNDEIFPLNATHPGCDDYDGVAATGFPTCSTGNPWDIGGGTIDLGGGTIDLGGTDNTDDIETDIECNASIFIPTNFIELWQGNGICQDINGNFYFNPQTAGIGEHQITYTFNCSATSCSVVETFTVGVYGPPQIVLKSSSICQDETTMANGTPGTNVVELPFDDGSTSFIAETGSFESSNESIATVDEFGLVTGIGSGFTFIKYYDTIGCVDSTFIYVSPKPILA